MAGLTGAGLQHLELGPRRFGVHVIGRDGRDAAPVVDARLEQTGEVGMREVRRRLQADLVGQDQPCHGERPEVVVERRLGRVDHLRAGLGAEVLDDHLLQVAVLGVQVAQREQRLDLLAARLADADQDARCGRDLERAHPPQCVEAHRRLLVGRAVVRHALLAQAGTCRLEHDPLARRPRTRSRQLRVAEDPGVGVRQQARLGEDAFHAVHEVRDGGLEAEFGQLNACGLVAQLGLVAEGEERLATPGGLALLGQRDDLVRGQVRALTFFRWLREGAVVADVAAQHRQRDEDLGRVRHHDAEGGITPGARVSAESSQIRRRILGECESLGIG